MDFSFLANFFDICSIDICLTHKELLSAIFGGMLTGGTAMLLYVFQKHLERKTNKFNMSTILHNEVKRIIEVVRLNETVNHYGGKFPRLPGTEIYNGLLSSGNIKYFENKLYNKLDEMYADFKENSLEPNLDLGIKVMVDLEMMINKNKSYRNKIFK